MTDRIRIWICEDDHRLREHLERMLREVVGFEITGSASTAEATRDRLATQPVDLLLLDLELPGMDGLSLLAQLPGPPAGPEVLIFTTFANAEKVLTAMRRGAAGYLVKGAPKERIAQAVRDVMDGGTVIEPRLARRFWNLFDASRGGTGEDRLGLTDEEIQVLDLVARGLTNPEVGGTLGTSRRRVKSHLESIYRKLGVRGRVEAVLKATAAGLIDV